MRDLFRKNRRLFIFLVVANFLLQFGHRIWQATFNNFAVERIGIGPDAVGWIQSVREIPGLLAIGLALLALIFSELRIVAASIVLLGVGILLTGQATTVPMLLVATLVMSIGFHFFGPASNGALMMSVDKPDGPRALGWMRTIAASAGVLGTVAILLLVERIGYEALFLTVGAVVIAGGLILFPLGSGGHDLPPRRKAKFRRRYWVFYVLAFLTGSRRHILTTFAPFLLVKDFHVAVQVMSILYLANSLINTYAHQMIGKAIARFGERWILSIACAALIPVFLGYALVSYLPILFGLFALDSVLFSFNAGLTTYIHKIAISPEELTANLAAQEAIGHIAAVFMPVFGGTLWILLGAQAPFLIGVGIAVVSLAMAQFVRVPRDVAHSGSAVT
jgi:MFS family permease